MNIILPILSFLCGVMLTETASGSSEEGKPSPGVVQELWFGIPGASVKDLTHRKIFETAAPDVRTISHLDVENLGDRYGARYSALLKVPASGKYRLYLSSDDSAELWLGKDASQKDMACIATVKGYSDIHNWGNQPNQASEPVQLEADRFYFLQVIHKEDGGPDHMSVAWSGPASPPLSSFLPRRCSYRPVSCRKKKTIPSQSGLKVFLITFPPRRHHQFADEKIDIFHKTPSINHFQYEKNRTSLHRGSPVFSRRISCS